jgi:HK97 family phage major capsid protein
MTINARELRARRADLIDEAEALVNAAELEDRDLNEEEVTDYEERIRQADALEGRAVRLENLGGIQQQLQAGQAVPVILRPGDSEQRAIGAFIRSGDLGGVSHMRDGDNSIALGGEQRASNDTTMNITTAADGGNVVPTGHFQGIIARRDEASIVDRLGVRRIPGKGTSVNVPFDNEDDGEFVSTAESGSYDRDAPALGQVTFTLVKYTKKVDLTVELLEDEDSRLMVFLEDFVGRGMAKTHNNLLLTEAAANGTSLKTFASATVIAVDELETIPFNEALGNYLDDAGSVAWVMQRAVHGEIILLDDANVRRYGPNTVMDGNGGFAPSLLGYPIVYSAKSGATAASTKSVYFGNWNFIGLYEAPGFSLIRDPYTRSSSGEVILNYMFRADYGTLVAEAIGYGVHPSA